MILGNPYRINQVSWQLLTIIATFLLAHFLQSLWYPCGGGRERKKEEDPRDRIAMHGPARYEPTSAAACLSPPFNLSFSGSGVEAQNFVTIRHTTGHR